MAIVMFRWLGVLILIVFFARKPVIMDWPVLRQNLGFIFTMGMLGFAGFNGLFYIAAHYTTAVNMGILQGSVPIFVLIGTYTAFKSKISLMQIIGVAITVLGVVIVATAGRLQDLINLSFNIGDGLMIIACLLYAGYTIGLRNRPRASALGLFTLFATAAFITSIPLVIVEVQLGYFQWPSIEGWTIIMLITLFPSFLAQIFFMNGVEAIGPGRAGVFVNLVPIFASIIAVAVLDESFEFFHGMALAFVLGGIFLSEHRQIK